MIRSLVRAVLPLACTLAFSLAACSSGDAGSALVGSENPGGTVFLAQNHPPQTVMEALFEGTVVQDEQGCLRLSPGLSKTVIWPYGFKLEARVGGLYVEDASGRTVGRIGGSFSFGGGNINTHEHASLTARDHVLAESRCPGTFWLVGDTN
jgi:hypothetical protein